jgi:hypothetical protein
MKNKAFKLFSICTGIIFIALLIGCSEKASENEALASKIQYDVPIVNNDPQLDWWINNLEGSRREPFLKRIMDAAERGEVKVYDYFENPMTPVQIRALSTDTVYKTLVRPYPPYDEYDTMIVKTISYRDIVKIRYLEEWIWDPSEFTMKKNVLAFGPVISKEISGQTYNQLLFWIHTADKRQKD